ncbi:cryptochrome/photolyase family protein [Paramicrobacterium agarici]|uniref:cryptochrome/photolyase family protein n=1 Tax=Paramicrobacterium agarici TaxID=630514 RepID=UPI0011544CD4|nr:deoxyribodipyrimidine photo-lyase [Microbacterium agarici]TQO23648.1 deoxyribodipyrimidine photo-lyase type I [Microbacterium agarici]
MHPSLVWLRDDLRLNDNPALDAAAQRERPVVVLFVLDEISPDVRPLGGAAKWWLHGSLESLASDVEAAGATFVLRRGRADEIVPAVAADISAGAVFWNRRYGAAERRIDADIKKHLQADGVVCASFSASLLHDPWKLLTRAGTPYSVFTPFWRAFRERQHPRPPLPRPRFQRTSQSDVDGEVLAHWALRPSNPDWAAPLGASWSVGEHAAADRLAEFLDTELAGYDIGRDVPGEPQTSRLSPHLRWGEISPHTVWNAVAASPSALAPQESVSAFMMELVWREFAWHTLFHFPQLATRNLRAQFDDFPWPPLNQRHLTAWQRGETGFALVDAGMRELWHTGTMHNRVRMVTASFLVKNLLVDWRHGERWFWDTLVDADPASNPFNWQWIAGSGADAVPYFRVFNPELQRKKFDAENAYVGMWAPEYLSANPPVPIVDLAQSRREALAAFGSIKSA